MSKTLDEIKEEYASSLYYGSWGHFLAESGAADVKLALPIIAKNYAKEKVNEALGLAAENLRYDDTGREGCTWGDTDFDSKSVEFGYNNAIEVAKESILKLKQ